MFGHQSRLDRPPAAVCRFGPAGVPITGRTHLHDIYDKKGRSGRMILIVARMELYDTEDNHLATADSRMVIRERPAS